MGVLTEIGIIRCVVVVVLLGSAWRGGAEAGCPSLCTCRKPEGAGSDAGSDGEPAPDEPLRLRCGPSPAQVTELKEIDFTNISGYVVSLNMSGNAISTLSRDLHLPNLQKLDLSRNQIGLIESDAFYNVSRLQRLDLSHNQISRLPRDVFKGLARLERLLLAANRLAALPPDSLRRLPALKLLDVADNPLECDCGLVWVGGWLQAAGVRLAAPARCAAPPALAGRPLRKLRALLPPDRCPPSVSPAAPLAPAAAAPAAALVLRPAADQLVFEGDALALACAAPLAPAAHAHELRWAHPALDACDVNVTAADVAEGGVAEVVAHLPNVSRHHAGEWTCLYSDERRTLTLVVIGAATRSCPTDVTADNKGLYSWPQLLLNRTAAVPCRAGAGAGVAGAGDAGDAVATRRCGEDGAWGRADTSRCAYVANVTRLLQQFALLDVGLLRYSARNASARLAALLRARASPPPPAPAELRDPDDVMFVARAVRNYMRYLPDEEGLGSALLDVISAAMDVTPAVMALAEAQYGACSQLVRAAEDLAAIPSDKQKSNFAVERFPVRAGWGGATCVWYSRADAGPRLHCTTTNRTVARLRTFSDAQVHASVQIPASLVHALAGGAGELVVGVFRDAALFPLLPADAPGDAHRAKDYYGRSTKREDTHMEITSPVVSVRLSGGRLAGELPEPLVGTLRAAGCGGSARAAAWDPALGRWHHNATRCRVLQYAGCTAVVALAAPGACALLARAERGIFGARTHGARFKPSHPAVYVGSLVLAACLAAAALTYAAAFPALAMPRRAKHAHLNTWLALGALCLLYALGVYQTEDAALCRALGLAIHYLSLSALLWMCVAAHALYRSVSRPPPPAPPPDAEPAPPRPVLGLYLAGWGVALIVVGISGAVNLREYAGYAQCFLSSAAALGALFVPGALLLLLLAALLLLTRCAARAGAAPEPWEPARAPSPGSLRSLAADAERAPLVQLRAQAAVLALYLATWASAAVAVYRPLPAYLPYQEDICSILYAVCATVLGTFVLFFYGIAREDVRAQWALMHCYLRRSKRCCRSRSVVDSAPLPRPPRAPRAPHPPADERSRSGSRSSARTAAKSDPGAPHEAGAELNGHTLAGAGGGRGAELLALHRRQYRPARPALARAREAGADVFYNPNQMNVAKKFFKRQRQHVRHNRLELPPRRDLDAESLRSLPLPAREPSPPENDAAAPGRGAGRGAGRSRARGDPPRRPDVDVYTDAAVSAQCSLDCSSPERAPDTPDTLAASAPCATTDTESFSRYVDCLRPAPAPAAAPAPAVPAAPAAPAADACSTNASEQGFENESDIYCPNYQRSELSIRSHGLYAPSPASLCAPSAAASAEDVSPPSPPPPPPARYVNLRARSPDSDLDELYTRITAAPALDLADLADLADSDVTLRPDSALSRRSASDPRAETAV